MRFHAERGNEDERMIKSDNTMSDGRRTSDAHLNHNWMFHLSVMGKTDTSRFLQH